LFAVATGAFVILYTAYWPIMHGEFVRRLIRFFYRLVLCHRRYCSSTFYFFRWLCTDNHPAVGPLILRGVVGGIIAIFSFGSIMMATRLDKVGEAAILRETSTNFAALIGWYFLKEPVGAYRSLMMFMVAFGAVFVEFGD